MPLTQTSPNMGIVVPVVLTQTGPAWATNIFNALFTTIDQHDHSSGKGVQIQPAGLNISGDLPFGSNNGTALRSVRFTQQASALVLGSDVGCIYDVLGNLFWNNASGTAVQITNGAAVNSASALTGPVVGTTRAITTTFTVDSVTPDYMLLADTTGGAFTLTLPTPTNGRTLVIVDSKLNFSTNNLTVAPHATEKINLVANSLLLSANGGRYVIESNGTDWFLHGD